MKSLLLALALSSLVGCSDYFEVTVRTAVDNRSSYPVTVKMGSEGWTGGDKTFVVEPGTVGTGETVMSRCSGDPCHEDTGPRITATLVKEIPGKVFTLVYDEPHATFPAQVELVIDGADGRETFALDPKLSSGSVKRADGGECAYTSDWRKFQATCPDTDVQATLDDHPMTVEQRTQTIVCRSQRTASDFVFDDESCTPDVDPNAPHRGT